MGLFTLAVTGEKSSQAQMIDKFRMPSMGGLIKSSLDEIKRIPPEELELLYARDPIGFNMVNTLTDMIMSGGYTIFSKDKKILNYYTTFFKEIGEIGEPITLKYLFENIYRNQFAYGNAFVQILWEKKGKKIIDLTLIDPKRVDYLKANDGRVILDENNLPIGYTIKKDYGDETKGDIIPEEYARAVGATKLNTYFLFAERICHFKINTIGDRLWGIGILEPSYKSTIRKLNIEEGQANSVYKNGFNPLVGYVGSERKVATPKDLEWVSELLSNLDVTKVGAFPDWVKIDTLKYDQSSIVPNTLEYMRENQISPAGIPMALASGKADTTNKSTLGIHLQLLQFKLKILVENTLETFSKYILERINYYNKVGGIPEIKWGPVGPADKENLVKDIIASVSQGIFTAKEVREKLAKELGISIDG